MANLCRPRKRAHTVLLLRSLLFPTHQPNDQRLVPYKDESFVSLECYPPDSDLREEGDLV